MIDKVTTIDQTGCSRLIYACKDLHAHMHGPIDRMDITNNGIICEFVGITNTTLSLTTTGPSNVSKDGDVMVAFDNAVFFKRLRKAIFAYGHDDLTFFEKNWLRTSFIAGQLKTSMLQLKHRFITGVGEHTHPLWVWQDPMCLFWNKP